MLVLHTEIKRNQVMERKFKAGDIVLVRRHSDVWRPITLEELAEWETSEDSRGLDSAGELKIPPRSRYWAGPEKTPFKIVKARIAAPRGYGGKISKCVEMIDKDGVHWFARRRDLL